jgi:multiple sugar transport system substrate-binding protein
MRIKLWFSFLMVALALTLVACGSGSTAAPTPAPAPDTSGDTVVVDPGDEMAVTLRWRTRPDNQAEIDVYQAISNKLDVELPGIDLVYEPGGSETASYQDVLKTELGAGTAPDVFWIPGTDIADFAKRGLILNMRSLANASPGHNDGDFYPGPMFHLTFNPDTGNSGEALWGLPRDVSTFALYLNLDLIDEAGAPDPRELAAAGQWNWDTFLQVAVAVDALGGDIFGYGQNAWWGPYGYWLNAAGGGFFTENRDGCALDTPESLAGLEFERRIYQEFDVAVPYGEDSEPPLWLVKSACSKTAVGPPPVSAAAPALTGTLSNCRMARPGQATGCSGALMSSMPIPPTRNRHGPWCRP